MAHASGAGAAEPPRLDLPPNQSLPTVVPSNNQQIADAVADQLRHSGQLHGYDVDVAVQNGAARLTGTVADQAQREEVLRVAHSVPGVERVLDRLTTAGTVAV